MSTHVELLTNVWGIQIFVRFETQDCASTALRSLAGRKFADRTVVCTYFSEVTLPFFPLPWARQMANQLV